MPELTFAGTGAIQIHARSWQPAGSARALVLLSHGYGEHSGRYEHVAAALTAAGYAVAAPDHQGHGRSGGTAGQIRFSAAVADLDTLLSSQLEQHPGVPAFLIGHSMGGAVALRYAIAHQGRLTGLVLSGPLVSADAHPLAKLIGQLVGRLAPAAPAVKLDPKLVSRDPAVVAAYEADPLVRHKPIAAGAAGEFVRHTDSIMADARSITIPTLLMWGTADGLCPAAGAEELATHLGAQDLTTHAYPGLFHEIFNEPEQDDVLATVVAWLNDHLS